MADYKKVILILSEARASIAAELKDDPHALRIDNTLSQLANNLSLLTGGDSEAKAAQKIGNATSIAGEPIAVKETVKAEDLEPEPDKVEILKAAVDTVHANFLKDTNAELLKLDKTVLRGVAKKAGLTDWKDGQLNSKYMDKIKAAIKKENERLQERIDAAQVTLSGIAKELGEAEEAEATPEAIAALEAKYADAKATLEELQNQLA